MSTTASTPPPPMLPVRRFLVPALWSWIDSSGLTPHIQVDATYPGVVVPGFAVKNGVIVLNLASRATSSLYMGDDEVTFSARFNGKSLPITVPYEAIQAIYARESGVGMMLSHLDPRLSGDTPPPNPESTPPSGDAPPRRGKPVLSIVK